MNPKLVGKIDVKLFEEWSFTLRVECQEVSATIFNNRQETGGLE